MHDRGIITYNHEAEEVVPADVLLGDGLNALQGLILEIETGEKGRRASRWDLVVIKPTCRTGARYTLSSFDELAPVDL